MTMSELKKQALDQNKAIVELFQAGWGIDALRRSYKLTESQICRIIREALNNKDDALKQYSNDKNEARDDKRHNVDSRR